MPDGRAQAVTIQPRDSVVYQVEGLEPGEEQSAQFLANTDVGVLGVRFLKPGQRIESTVHEHMDGFWVLKSGRARLTGGDGEVIGELDRGDGATIRRGARYAFEALDPGDGSVTELIQFNVADAVLPARLSGVKKELGLH